MTHIGTFSLQQVAQSLGGEVTGEQVLAPGPNHSAKDRSMAVRLDPGGPDGFVVNSFAGNDALACKDYIRTKLGIPWEAKAKRKIVATYDYKDLDGTLLYQVVRFDPKNFLQRRPDGGGGWIWKLEDRRVIYRWPEIDQWPDNTVYLVEGEKDADRMLSLGFCATTVAGDGKWSQECIEALAERHVIILEDNDEKGLKRGAAAAAALQGTAASIMNVRLPGLPLGGDVSDWLNTNPAENLADICMRSISTAAEPADTSAEATDTGFELVTPATWRDKAIEPMKWLALNRIPATDVAILSGDGGQGKTTLALQLAVSVACKLGDWVGTTCESGPVLMFSGEEDEPEMRRRLGRVCTKRNINPNEIENLHFYFADPANTLLGSAGKTVLPTPLFAAFARAVKRLKPALVVIDSVAAVYGGNHIDRVQVRTFVSLFRQLAHEAGCAILLLDHPSLSGMSNGSGRSGSMDWQNAVRSFMYLRPVDREDGSKGREMEVMKVNGAAPGEKQKLCFEDGCFILEETASAPQRSAATSSADQIYLDCLDVLSQRGINVNHATGRGYAPKEFAKLPEAKGMTSKGFEQCQHRLFSSGQIWNEPYGAPSAGKRRIARKAVS